MATEVLRPQDCLIGSHPGYARRKSIHGGVAASNPGINRKKKVGEPEMLKSSPVTILRRGESLDGRSKVGQMGMGRVGRKPGDVYAGSAFLSTSPPPASSLPLPSFSTRKMDVAVLIDDSASRDLRRLLRLE